MQLRRLPLSLVVLFVPAYVLANPPYFIINEPSKGTEWVNGQTHYATWVQGLDQGVPMFDVELGRLSTDGLLLVALNVPSSASSLPIMLQDVPSGEDYYLIFINSTHGLMQSLSSRFSILPASNASNASTSVQPPRKQQLATVTVSGAPNPTANFAYTFPATSGAREARTVCGVGAALVGLVVSLFWTVW